MSETLKQSLWDNSRKQYPQLQDGYPELLRTKGDIAHGFIPDRSPAVCVDEGLRGRFRLAGVGALLDPEHAGEILRRMHKAGANAVKSHKECGAAAKANPDNPELHSRQVAIRGAAEADLPSGHISQLNRPDGFHHAVGTVVDFTGRFDGSKIEGLPPTFAVSGKYVGPEIAVDEAALTTSIAFGDYGFGDLFTEEDPFRIIAVMDPHRDSFDPKSLQGIVDLYDRRVAVDIVTPAKQLLAKAER